MARKFTVNLPATAFVPQAGTTGCQLVSHTVSNVPRTALAFDDSTDESAVSQSFEWPDQSASGTVKATIYWYGTATSNNVVWNVSVEAETPGASGATLDMVDGASGFDSDNAVTATVTATEGEVAATSVTLTNKDSVAAADIVRIKIMRDADNGSDNFSGDAFVPLISVYEEA